MILMPNSQKTDLYDIIGSWIGSVFGFAVVGSFALIACTGIYLVGHAIVGN